MAIKMNTLLGICEHAASVAKKEISEYTKLFVSKQSMFKGELKTYTPREGYPDKPSEHVNTRVAATVDEEFQYMLNDGDPHSGGLPRYLKLLFAKEATNSKGAYRVPLVVEGVTLGVLSADELMRLKNILTTDSLDVMIKSIPVRSDAVRWVPTTDPDYAGRSISETEVSRSIDRIGDVKQEILRDPNIDPQHIPANYRPAIINVKETYEVGDQTRQLFSGEWTQTQKAYLMSRKSLVLNAVIAALKEVNEVEAEQSNLDVDAMLQYIFNGKK